MKRIVSQWGHDFRPAYLKFLHLKVLPKTPFLALTASVTPRVKTDIIQQLSLEKILFEKSFARPNITYMVLM
jgi:ATP-dependent DNA helicase RecQ